MPTPPQKNTALLTKFTHEHVNITQQHTLYSGFFKMEQYTLQHKLFAGGWSKPIVREMFERGHAVALLPYDPVTDEFVLIQQFRLGAMATSDSPWLVEVIAGMIDPGFDAEVVCHKEAEEEAGIALYDVVEVCSYLSSPGGTTERLRCFIAKTDSTQADGIHGVESESEDIKVLRVPRCEAKKWLETGVIDNAAAIILLQHFFLHETKYRNIDT
ncbi:MAG: NUDIX domain-containing protein [Glaciecola sp.]|jgi:ADP-ribose pyrophosphatase